MNRKANSHNPPSGDNYVKRRRSFNESAAIAALTLAAHRVLLRLEVELLRHGGKNNGKLICTYDDFKQFGIRRMSIAPAIRLLVEVGLIEITDRGWRLAAHGRPAQYRLTYLPAYGKPPTDEWKAYTPAQTHVVAKTPLHGAEIQERKRYYTL
jgi:hypothetical protein